MKSLNSAGRLTDFTSTLPQSIGSAACSSLIFLWVSVLAVDASLFAGTLRDFGCMTDAFFTSLWHNVQSSVCGRASFFICKAYLFSVPLIAPALYSGLC